MGRTLFYGGLECVGHSFAYVSNFVQYFLEMSDFEPKELPLQLQAGAYQLCHASPQLGNLSPY
jgi:hypothetical protein